ncbi:MAG: choice-of-anchor X domain-containing protein [Candidatus Marinimicrobia bacterium]|nr:choice-of-anchor X domain-containing protein [Candidatus Neomarinimicrobiota bacterium]
MKIKINGMILLSALLLAGGCGPTYPEDEEDQGYPVPELSRPALSYHPGRGELHCGIRVLYDHDIREVQADISLQGFENEGLSVALNDSGALGDALPYDNIFSQNIALEHIDSLDGRVIVEYIADKAGSPVQTLYDTLLIEANLPPFITEVEMPDTLIRPRTGTKALYIYVHVDDPNGIHDVTHAFFQVLKNESGSWGADYSLYDNGEGGDRRAGDGIFSAGLQISAENQAVTNYFRFRAKDAASNFSDWSVDSVVVR